MSSRSPAAVRSGAGALPVRRSPTQLRCRTRCRARHDARPSLQAAACTRGRPTSYRREPAFRCPCGTPTGWVLRQLRPRQQGLGLAARDVFNERFEIREFHEWQDRPAIGGCSGVWDRTGTRTWSRRVCCRQAKAARQFFARLLAACALRAERKRIALTSRIGGAVCRDLRVLARWLSVGGLDCEAAARQSWRRSPRRPRIRAYWATPAHLVLNGVPLKASVSHPVVTLSLSLVSYQRSNFV